MSIRFYDEYKKEIWISVAVVGGAIVIYCSAGTLTPAVLEFIAYLKAAMASYGYATAVIFVA